MPDIKGYSLTTGWGDGLQSLPANALAAAAGQRLLPLPTPAHGNDRLRRATRECVLAVNAVEHALTHSGLTHDDLAGPRTAMVYASASAYAAANWTLLNDDQGAYFPYTAPSAVPGEVTIQFGITGPYISLLSGANAGIEALWQALTLLSTDQCDRALVVGIETFSECETLFTAGRWLLDQPLVEAAVCLIIESDSGQTSVGYQAGNTPPAHVLDAFPVSFTEGVLCLCTPTTAEARHTARRLQADWPRLRPIVATERTGTCLASTTLIGLLLCLTQFTHDNVLLMSHWWDAWSVLHWPGTSRQPQETPHV